MIVLMMAPSVPLDAQIIDHQNDTIGSAWFRREAGQTLDTDGQVVTTVAHSSENAPIKSWLHQDASVTWAMASTDTIWSLNMAFVGEDFDPQATTLTLGETGGLANYYLAHTGTGITGVQAYRGIKRVDIYPRVDLQHHYGSAGHKMTFVFRPGADPSAVQLFFSGQDSLGVDVQGMLRVYLGQRFLKLEEAFAYQLGPNDVLIPVAWTPSYDARHGGGLVSFTFGSYDSSKPLVFAIGPPPLAGGGGGGPDNLEWSTMVGTDLPSTVDDHGNALAAADDGSVCLAGSSDDPSYPVAPGALAYQGGLWDAYMMRFRYAPGNPLQDATRDWVTYYGGTDRERFTELRVSNNNSRLYAVGWTTSEDVIKLPNVDPMDATYFQASLSGTTDGVFAAFDPLLGTLQRAFYFGGNGVDLIAAIEEDVNGRIFLAGTTSTSTGGYNACNATVNSLPLCDPATANYQQAASAGGTDCFLVALTSGYAMQWSTFYGSPADDEAYDLAYLFQPTGPSSTEEALVLVGRTSGTMPQQGPPGLFQQVGTGSENGFLASFRLGPFLGEPAWTTNLNGLKGLYAASVHDGRVTVLGVGRGDQPPVVNACTAAPGAISICNPGGLNPWVEDVQNHQDHYLAEFDLLNGQLLWGTFFGGNGDEYAEEVRLLAYTNWHPFDLCRFYHLRHDGDGHLYLLGIVAQLTQPAPASFPTVPATPFYHLPYNTLDGNSQTQVVLACFLNDHSLFWSTVFGSRFDHMSDVQDAWKIDWGNDFGYGLALVEGEALYWGGSAGGWSYDDRCPYPGVSYCEPSLTSGSLNTDNSDAFVARMSLRELVVSATDAPGPTEGLIAWPNPATDRVQVTYAGLHAGSRLRLTDALGRVVAWGRSGMPHLELGLLPPGLYDLACVDERGVVMARTSLMVR